MAALTVGRKPDLLRVLLTPRSDFGFELATEDEDGFVLTPSLSFELLPLADDSVPSDVVWLAEMVTEYLARWTRSAEEVDDLLAEASGIVRLMYGDTVWAIGRYEVAE